MVGQIQIKYNFTESVDDTGVSVKGCWMVDKERVCEKRKE